MDSLANERQRLGLAVTVRSIGPVKDVGMAAGVEDEMLRLGLIPVPVNVVVDSFDSGCCEIVCGMKPMFGTHMLKQTSLFEGLGDVETRKVVEDKLVCKFKSKNEITTEMSRIVESITSEMVDLNAPLMEAGLDSLSAVELRNSMQQSFCMKVSGTVLFDHPTIAEIVDMILREGLTEEKEYRRTYDVVEETEECVVVDNLVICRKGYGKIEYMGRVSFEKENFPAILEDVLVGSKEVDLEGDAQYLESGCGLNGCCIVTLFNYIDTELDHEALQATFMEQNILLLEYQPEAGRVRLYRESVN